MARHRKSRRTAPTLDGRRRLVASGLFGASALAATALTLTVTPKAPPAPDRAPPDATTLPDAQAAP